VTAPHFPHNPQTDPAAQSTPALMRLLDAYLAGEPGDVEPALLTESLKNRLGPRGQGHMAVAQINTTPGDLQGNAERIMRHIALGEALNLDLVIFPELALMGYPPRDVIIRHPFLVRENLKWLQAIAERTGATYALVGFVEPRTGNPGDDGAAQRRGKEFFNALAVLGEGKIRGIVRKSLLPAYNEFEDDRQFEPSPASGVHAPETLGRPDWGRDETPPGGRPIKIHGHTYGLSICEDMWNDADFFSNPLYGRDPMAELAGHRPEVLVNVSASPTRSRKEQMKHNLCGHLARKYGIPLVYANQVGSVDEVAFDGASRVYDARGQLVARGKAFAEQFLIVNPLLGEGPIEALPVGLESTLGAYKGFNAYDTSDLGRTYESLLQGIRDYFRKVGFQRAVLGLSGGLDSSVTVVLLADALGPENVLGVGMPSRLTPDDNRADAQALADNLGIQLVEVPIGEITEAFGAGLDGVRSALAGHWGASDPRSNATDNVQAISRATVLRQLGNEFRALPVATSDKSELYLGYATVNGDMSGALAPLGDLPKTKVRALARWLNENRRPGVKTPRGVLPESVITKPSGADLKLDPATGKLVTAEAELMPYEFADEIIWRIETLKQGLEDMRAVRFQYEEIHVLSPAQKAEWLKKFFDRMAKAVFKWFVCPPILMVEGNGSIAKTDYHHPIVAGRIRWEGHAQAEIDRFLDEIRARSGPGRLLEKS
jgi:NAD+ synthase (glutamine-hydrolysing)